MSVNKKGEAARGTTIATRIARFHEAPPAPREQRAGEGNKFWWQDRASTEAQAANVYASMPVKLSELGRARPNTSDIHGSLDQGMRADATGSTKNSGWTVGTGSISGHVSGVSTPKDPGAPVLAMIHELSSSNPALYSVLSHIERDSSGRLSASTLARINGVLTGATDPRPSTTAPPHAGSAPHISAPSAAPVGSTVAAAVCPPTASSGPSSATAGPGGRTLDGEDSADSLAAAMARYRQGAAPIQPRDDAGATAGAAHATTALLPQSMPPSRGHQRSITSAHAQPPPGAPAHASSTGGTRADSFTFATHTLNRPAEAPAPAATFPPAYAGSAPAQPCVSAILGATAPQLAASAAGPGPAPAHVQARRPATALFPASGAAGAGVPPRDAIMALPGPALPPASAPELSVEVSFNLPSTSPASQPAPPAHTASVAAAQPPVPTAPATVAQLPKPAPLKNSTSLQARSSSRSSPDTAEVDNRAGSSKPSASPAAGSASPPSSRSTSPTRRPRAASLTHQSSLPAELPPPPQHLEKIYQLAVGVSGPGPQQPPATRRPANPPPNPAPAPVLNPQAVQPSAATTQPQLAPAVTTIPVAATAAAPKQQPVAMPASNDGLPLPVAAAAGTPRGQGQAGGTMPAPAVAGPAAGSAAVQAATVPDPVPATGKAAADTPAAGASVGPVPASAAPGTTAAPAAATGAAVSSATSLQASQVSQPPLPSLPAVLPSKPSDKASPTGPQPLAPAAGAAQLAAPSLTLNPPPATAATVQTPTLPQTAAPTAAVSISQSGPISPGLGSPSSPVQANTGIAAPNATGQLDVSRGWPAGVPHGVPLILPGTAGMRPPMMFVPTAPPSPSRSPSRSPSPDLLYGPTHMFVPASPEHMPQLISLPGHPSYPMPTPRSPSSSPQRTSRPPSPLPARPHSAPPSDITLRPTPPAPAGASSPPSSPPLPVAPAAITSSTLHQTATQPTFVIPPSAPGAPATQQTIAPLGNSPDKTTASSAAACAPAATGATDKPTAGAAGAAPVSASSRGSVAPPAPVPTTTPAAPATAPAPATPAGAKPTSPRPEERPSETEATRRARDVLELESRAPPATRLHRLVSEVEAVRRRAKEEAIRREEKAKLQKMKWDELEGYLGVQAAAVQDIRRLRWDNTTLTREMGAAPPRKLATQFLQQAEAMRSAAIDAAVGRLVETEAHREELALRDAAALHTAMDMQHALGLRSHRHALDSAQILGEAAHTLIAAHSPNTLTGTYWSRSAGSSPSRPRTGSLGAPGSVETTGHMGSTGNRGSGLGSVGGLDAGMGGAGSLGVSASGSIAHPGWYSSLLSSTQPLGAAASLHPHREHSSSSSSSSQGSSSDSGDREGGSAANGGKGKRKGKGRATGGAGAESISAAVRQVSLQLDSAVSHFLRRTAGVSSQPHVHVHSHAASPRHADLPHQEQHAVYRVQPDTVPQPGAMPGLPSGGSGLAESLMLAQQQAIAAQQAALALQQHTLHQRERQQRQQAHRRRYNRSRWPHNSSSGCSSQGSSSDRADDEAANEHKVSRRKGRKNRAAAAAAVVSRVPETDLMQHGDSGHARHHNTRPAKVADNTHMEPMPESDTAAHHHRPPHTQAPEPHISPTSPMRHAPRPSPSKPAAHPDNAPITDGSLAHAGPIAHANGACTTQAHLVGNNLPVNSPAGQTPDPTESSAAPLVMDTQPLLVPDMAGTPTAAIAISTSPGALHTSAGATAYHAHPPAPMPTASTATPQYASWPGLGAMPGQDLPTTVGTALTPACAMQPAATAGQTLASAPGHNTAPYSRMGTQAAGEEALPQPGTPTSMHYGTAPHQSAEAAPASPPHGMQPLMRGMSAPEPPYPMHAAPHVHPSVQQLEHAAMLPAATPIGAWQAPVPTSNPRVGGPVAHDHVDPQPVVPAAAPGHSWQVPHVPCQGQAPAANTQWQSQHQHPSLAGPPATTQLPAAPSSSSSTTQLGSMTNGQGWWHGQGMHVGGAGNTQQATPGVVLLSAPAHLHRQPQLGGMPGSGLRAAPVPVPPHVPVPWLSAPHAGSTMQQRYLNPMYQSLHGSQSWHPDTAWPAGAQGALLPTGSAFQQPSTWQLQQGVVQPHHMQAAQLHQPHLHQPHLHQQHPYQLPQQLQHQQHSLEHQARLWAAGQGVAMPSPPPALKGTRPPNPGWSWHAGSMGQASGHTESAAALQATRLQLEAVYGPGAAPYDL